MMSIMSTIGLIATNYMYSNFKVSWSIIILNLQIVFVFMFDVLVMKV